MGTFQSFFVCVLEFIMPYQTLFLYQVLVRNEAWNTNTSTNIYICTYFRRRTTFLARPKVAFATIIPDICLMSMKMTSNLIDFFRRVIAFRALNCLVIFTQNFQTITFRIFSFGYFLIDVQWSLPTVHDLRLHLEHFTWRRKWFAMLSIFFPGQSSHFIVNSSVSSDIPVSHS